MNHVDESIQQPMQNINGALMEYFHENQHGYLQFDFIACPFTVHSPFSGLFLLVPLVPNQKS